MWRQLSLISAGCHGKEPVHSDVIFDVICCKKISVTKVYFAFTGKDSNLSLYIRK